MEEKIQKHFQFKTKLNSTKKHLPTHHCKSTQNTPVSGLAIGQHLLDNKICPENFNINQFLILSTMQSFFHLATLEATFIESLKPSLCRQKDLFFGLKLSCYSGSERANKQTRALFL